MSQQFRDYKEYVTDPKWAKTYSNYQSRYVVEPRESDKKSAQLVLSALSHVSLDRPPRILDIGCSTGNFLRHLKTLLPNADLTGGDLMAAAVEECCQNPQLTGIGFEAMDVFFIPTDRPWDVIVANAVNVYFDYPDYERAIRSIATALTPGGTFIAYEWVLEGEREQRIVEQSDGHPNGLKFWFRSEYRVGTACREAGFKQIIVEPFDIPIDLPARTPTPEEPDAHLYTRTVLDPLTGRRRMFRGTLEQPWAHIIAVRGAVPNPL
jgi:SAM-dependent methyltransferase